MMDNQNDLYNRNDMGENRDSFSSFTEGTLSPSAYNVAIGVHLLAGLLITFVLALRIPYVLPQVYSVHPVVFSIGFLVLGIVGGKLCFVVSRLWDEYFGICHLTFHGNDALSGKLYPSCSCAYNGSGTYDDRCRNGFPECFSFYGKNDFYCFDRTGYC